VARCTSSNSKKLNLISVLQVLVLLSPKSAISPLINQRKDWHNKAGPQTKSVSSMLCLLGSEIVNLPTNFQRVPLLPRQHQGNKDFRRRFPL
jgi:hypothetical protein